MSMWYTQCCFHLKYALGKYEEKKIETDRNVMQKSNMLNKTKVKDIKAHIKTIRISVLTIQYERTEINVRLDFLPPKKLPLSFKAVSNGSTFDRKDSRISLSSAPHLKSL